MKLLCVGDIHLGRQPSRITSAPSEHVAASNIGPTAAWRRTVDEALRLQVDAVLLAGDVVDRNDDFYEAYEDLRIGVERLTQADIRVLGVAGNHDVLVLPRLADALPHFRLLGRGGRWETERVTDTEGATLQVLGWSFPQEIVTTSPLAESLPKRDSDTTIGLLHCDRDQANSRYAPVRSAELDQADVDAWLLGHIHKPDSLTGARPIGYLGSLSALDPGEPGPHGPWLLEVVDGGQLSMRQIPLAPMRWETLDVDVGALAHAEDVHQRITAALDILHSRIDGEGATPLAVGCRLRLIGRTRFRDRITRILQADDPRTVPQERGDIVYFVERWQLDALPEIDLAELARTNDLVGLLAKQLVTLHGPDTAQRQTLISRMQNELAAAARDPVYSALGTAEPDTEHTAEIAESAALRALDMLLAQGEDAA